MALLFRLMRVKGSLLPSVPFPDSSKKQTPTQARLSLPLECGQARATAGLRRPLWRAGASSGYVPLQGLCTKSPCLSPNTSSQIAQFPSKPPMRKELAAFGPETNGHIWAPGPESLLWPVLCGEK